MTNPLDEDERRARFIARERAKLARFQRGPEWTSIIMAFGQDQDLPPVMPVIGIDETPGLRTIMDSAVGSEFDFSSQWVLMTFEEQLVEAWLDIAFARPVKTRFTLCFAGTDVALFQALVSNGGVLLIAFDKEHYATEHLPLTDIETDIPALVLDANRRSMDSQNN